MAAKKRAVNKTSYYLLSLEPDNFDDRGSESVLGKVISFFLLICFVLFCSVLGVFCVCFVDV